MARRDSIRSRRLGFPRHGGFEPLASNGPPPRAPGGQTAQTKSPTGARASKGHPRGTQRDLEEPRGIQRNPEEPRGTWRDPEEPRGTWRDLEGPRGTQRNLEESRGTQMKPVEQAPAHLHDAAALQRRHELRRALLARGTPVAQHAVFLAAPRVQRPVCGRQGGMSIRPAVPLGLSNLLINKQ